MQAINGVIDEMIVKGDASGYVRTNLEFHRTLYLRAQAPAMLGLIETVWLQAGPTMRMLYERLQRRQASDNHRKIIAALRAGDEPGLRLAIRMDVTQGLRMLVSLSTRRLLRTGRGDWIRTSDLRYPKPPRYQAAPRPAAVGSTS